MRAGRGIDDMAKTNVLKGVMILAVVGICGIGVFQTIRDRRDSGMQRQKPDSTEGAVQTPVSSPSQKETAAAESPIPDSKKIIKKHREGKSVWTYNKQTRCLVISGKGEISVHGNDDTFWDIDPGYYPWSTPSYRPAYAHKVKKIIIKPGITCINEGVFYEYPSLKTVVLSDTVTDLEGYAFWRCSSLSTLTMGKNIRKIGAQAFYGCSSLSSIALGRNVEKIGDNAFQGCSSLQRITLDRRNASFSLKSGLLYNSQKTVLYLCPAMKRKATIPQGVKEIAPAAFAYCNELKKIAIPASVERLGDSIFYQCGNLEKISLSPNLKCQWTGAGMFDYCTSLKEIVLPDSVRYINGTLINCKSLKRIYLGSSFAGFTSAETWEEAEKGKYEPSADSFMGGVTYGKIKEYNVSEANPWYTSQGGVLYNKDKTRLLCYPQGKKDKTVKIPDSVQVIRGKAFHCNRNIEKAVLPKSLQKIGGNAFSWCENLKSVKIPGKNVVIGPLAFGCCQLLSQVELGNGVRQIKSDAFYDTKLKEIHIPASVEKIGRDALGKWCERTKLEGGTLQGTTRDVIGFTIYGKKGSVAERYAKRYVFDFVAE